MTKTVSFHIDLDSPRQLLRFWGLENVRYSDLDLDHFYEVGMERALSIFKEYNIPVTFFCVGNELESSIEAKRSIKEAYVLGHEIANHTYAHPFGFTKLSELDMILEIKRCSEIIKKITGSNPVGFRSPGYDINTRVLNVLEDLSFEYDSSAFWSILNLFFKPYYKLFKKGKEHGGFGETTFKTPTFIYYPSQDDWQRRITLRRIVELPLPSTNIFKLPFYNNFHLSVNNFYRKLAIDTINQTYFVYLFHLIEFCDLDDGIPKELCVHPNIKTKKEVKIEIIRDTIKRIINRYEAVRTDKFVQNFRSNTRNF